MCQWCTEWQFCKWKECKYSFKKGGRSTPYKIYNDVLWEPCQAKKAWARAQNPPIDLQNGLGGDRHGCQPGDATYSKSRTVRKTKEYFCSEAHSILWWEKYDAADAAAAAGQGN